MRKQFLLKEHDKLATDHNEAKSRFILTELELAITFCELALSATDHARSSRNTKNAREAYRAANHFLEDANFSDKMKAGVEERVSKLKILLRYVTEPGRVKRLSLLLSFPYSSSAAAHRA